MQKTNKRIAIVRTSLYGCSSLSQVSSDAILIALQTKFTDVWQSEINTREELEQLIISKPDLVFLGFKSLPAIENLPITWVSDELERHGIQHTGSDHIAGMLERSKNLSKDRVIAAGLASSEYIYNNGDQELDIVLLQSLGYPLFVKPANLGGGEGINSASVVHNLEQLESQIAALQAVGIQTLIIEKYLSGREFSVAILRKAHSDVLQVMPIELVASVNEHGDRLLSQQVKSENGESVLQLSNDTNRKRVSDLAEQAFHALGARDYARIDIRSDGKGTPHFLEANLIPSLIAGYGSFPKACMMNLGMDYITMIISIANLGLERVSEAEHEAVVPSPAFA